MDNMFKWILNELGRIIPAGRLLLFASKTDSWECDNQGKEEASCHLLKLLNL